MKYRLLDEGEIIQNDDETLVEIHIPWQQIGTSLVGRKFSEEKFCPVRRLIKSKESVPEQKTITVRIAVGVNPKTKEWTSWGSYFGRLVDDLDPDNHKIEMVVSAFEDDVLPQIHWIEAVIPITEPPVIVGTVTEGE